VIVSRAAPSLVQTLFQSEVPEIYDGTVMIRAIAREAGERTKIAVVSRDKDVDPVGACVGMKGMRVQSIIRELRGEKIDIIEFSEEITTFAEKALQPAKVSRVSITDLGEKQLEVIVDDTQLSLAIGKKGQNVRLAAKLLGWKIDIKSEEEKRQEVEQAMSALGGGPSTAIEAVSELGEHVLEKLIAAGITTVEHLADMTAEELGEVPGIGEKSVEKIAVAVRHYFGQYEEGEERPAGAVSETAAALGDNGASESSVSHDTPTEEDGKPYDPASETEGSEEGEVLLLAADQNEPGGVEGDLTEESSMSKTPEAIIAERGIEGYEPIEVDESAEELLEREDAEGQLDGFGSDEDISSSGIEMNNQTMDDLAALAGETGSETIDPDENTRG
jgi:N utilization substance protein A